MSQFLRTVNQFRHEFQVGNWDSAKLLFGYPIFKAAWFSQYGTGWKKAFSNSLLKIFESSRMEIAVRGNGGEVRVPVAFQLWDLDSFKEIFWGQEYLAPFPFETISTYVDLGANTGMAALYFSTKCNLKKMILVEANPGLAKRLSKLKFSCEADIVNGFVSGVASAPMNFFLHENHRNSGLNADESGKAEKISVDQIPLRKILKEKNLEEAHLLKMDIEGGEYSILSEDAAVFQKFRYLCAELHGSRAERDGFATKLGELGFEILQRKEAIPVCEMLFAARK